MYLRYHFLLVASLLASWEVALAQPATTEAADTNSATLSGELRRWHSLTLSFDGPESGEEERPNPFLDFRLRVTFAHQATSDTLFVPGYFAADGNAAETGAASGNQWRVHFTPHKTGSWTYLASFRTGPDVAISLDPMEGQPVAFDGAKGSFEVVETNKKGRDHRARGLLRYVGTRYLRFDDGSYFVKGGADSPENLLAYVDFDGTYSLAVPGQQRTGEAPTSPLHGYEPHRQDWNSGDPSWRGNRGRNLVGALNYLAGKGANAFSFLTMNVEGDGEDVWPWIAPDVRDRFDVSKLAQWEIIFTHADSLGLFLHFKTQETENDLLLDNGDLGPVRMLYYRELVARFAHHHALNWNLGEENDIWEELGDPTQERLKSYIRYLHALDPYDHPVVVHTYPGQQEEVYTPLLGEGPGLDGVSIQTDYDQVHDETLRWVKASAAAGRPWVVANDEQGHYTVGVMPDGPDSNRDVIRQRTLWGNLMAGGGGVEYYFGYEFPHNDLNAEDWRSRDGVWDDVRHALAFFNEHLPFWKMEPADSLAFGPEAYVLTSESSGAYAVYLPAGGRPELHLPADGARYAVRWYDPRTGGALNTGTISEVTGNGQVALGDSPGDPDADWLVLVRRQNP